MRRFVEEIHLRTPVIARKIIRALEDHKEYSSDPIYEVDMYERSPDILSNRPAEDITLKIFVREDDV